MDMARATLAIACAVLGACAARAPRTEVGALGPGLDAYLAAHALAAGEGSRVDEVARGKGASYHLVQVRGSESSHRHAAHDLTVVMLRGRGTLTLEGTAVPLHAGDVAFVPRGAAHWFASGGRSPAVALIVMTPPLEAPQAVPPDGG